ncbi:MAG TPA: hypothetical protein ENJ27_01375 [Candidatus Moranbacteria bacterium]|nr:hypothetical protein [Candidatus Moranbacteria bacterium]
MANDTQRSKGAEEIVDDLRGLMEDEMEQFDKDVKSGALSSPEDKLKRLSFINKIKNGLDLLRSLEAI